MIVDLPSCTMSMMGSMAPSTVSCLTTTLWYLLCCRWVSFVLMQALHITVDSELVNWLQMPRIHSLSTNLQSSVVGLEYCVNEPGM